MYERFNSLQKARFTKRVEALATVGNAGTVGQVQRSKKDKLNDPKRQRKEKRWLNDD